MTNIYLTSDLHLGHDREFIYQTRGFSSIEEHDEAIIEQFNSMVGEDDDVFILGDLMLGDTEHGLECLRRLHGRLHIARGNHDTDRRIELYRSLPAVVEIKDIINLKYRGYHFYCSHYPTITGNSERYLKQMTLNLFGHTHQATNFYEDRPYMYHVGVDSHHMKPVHLDDIVTDMCDHLQSINKRGCS